MYLELARAANVNDVIDSALTSHFHVPRPNSFLLNYTALLGLALLMTSWECLLEKASPPSCANGKILCSLKSTYNVMGIYVHTNWDIITSL